MLNIPFDKSVVTGLKPQASAGDPKSAWIIMGNALRVFIIVTLSQIAGASTKISLLQAQGLDGTGEKVLAKDIPIHFNEDISATDVIAQAPDGVSYTVTDDIKGKKVIFQVDGEDLDVNGGFSAIAAEVTTGHASNFVAIEYVCQGRFPGQEFTK